MGRINWGRVVLGGILAGIVINVSEFLLNAVVLADDFAAAMAALNRPVAESPRQITVWILWGFILGILAVWLYAAIRPRFGPGPRTAVKAGLMVWFLSYALPWIGMLNMGLFPSEIIAVGMIWGLFEIMLATAFGAWVYKEA